MTRLELDKYLLREGHFTVACSLEHKAHAARSLIHILKGCSTIRGPSNADLDSGRLLIIYIYTCLSMLYPSFASKHKLVYSKSTSKKYCTQPSFIRPYPSHSDHYFFRATRLQSLLFDLHLLVHIFEEDAWITDCECKDGNTAHHSVQNNELRLIPHNLIRPARG